MSLPLFLRLALVLALLVSLCGCSLATRFVYNHLDWFALRELGDYIDLSRQQKAWLEPRFDAVWDWHRRDQLPRYAEVLHGFADRIEGEALPAQAIESFVARMQAFGEPLKAQARPHVLELLAQLSDEQAAELIDRLDQERAEAEQELAETTEAERRAEAAKRMGKWLRKRIGRLDDAQEAVVEWWAGERVDLNPLWIARQQQWQTEFRQALAERGSESGQARLDALLFESETSRPAALQAGLTRNRQLWAEAMARIHELATDRQRLRLAGFLRGYAEDFEALSGAS